MQNLPTTYLLEISRQFAFLGAFLGGFAATFLVTLLGVHANRRSTGWAVGCAAVAAICFVVSAVTAVSITIVLHPAVPANVSAGASVNAGRVISTLGFGLGVYALLAAVGLSGWTRSRRVGLVTSVCAGLGAVLVSWALTGFR